MEGGAPPARASTRLGQRSWWGVLKRAVTKLREDNLTDWAAALTYYGILAIFPALLVVISVLGLVGRSATQPLIENLEAFAPGAAQEIFTSAIRNLQQTRAAAGTFFVVGLATALWSASAYVGAFMRASNSIYETDEERPIYKTLPVRFGLTLVLLLLLAVIATGVVVTGDLAQKAGDLLGVGETTVDVWQLAKWPVLVFVVSLVVALLYWAAPDVRPAGFRWVSAGGLVAVLGWVLCSAAFAFYVANFGSYNKTYGALGGVIIFLIWLWLSNLMVLLGAELNAELERGRHQGPHPADPDASPRAGGEARPTETGD
jgi:membrane protein